MGPQARNGTNPGGPPASPFLTAVGGFRACRKRVVCVNGREGWRGVTEWASLREAVKFVNAGER
jgi:hypothetical protein